MPAQDRLHAIAYGWCCISGLPVSTFLFFSEAVMNWNFSNIDILIIAVSIPTFSSAICGLSILFRLIRMDDISLFNISREMERDLRFHYLVTLIGVFCVCALNALPMVLERLRQGG
jgi:hypothetical protein